MNLLRNAFETVLLGLAFVIFLFLVAVFVANFLLVYGFFLFPAAPGLVLFLFLTAFVVLLLAVLGKLVSWLLF